MFSINAHVSRHRRLARTIVLAAYTLILLFVCARRLYLCIALRVDTLR